MIEFRDSAGNLLVERGVHTSQAEEHIYICFDKHPLVGRRAWLFRTSALKEYVLRMVAAGVNPSSGSKGWGIDNTGVGYKANPIALFGFDIGLLPHENNEHDVIKRIFKKWGYEYRKATQNEEYAGIDYVTKDKFGERCTFELKRRNAHQAWDDIFLQTHESNPDKVYD